MARTHSTWLTQLTREMQGKQGTAWCFYMNCAVLPPSSSGDRLGAAVPADAESMSDAES
jgi:hypothetical protein